MWVVGQLGSCVFVFVHGEGVHVKKKQKKTALHRHPLCRQETSSDPSHTTQLNPSLWAPPQMLLLSVTQRTWATKGLRASDPDARNQHFANCRIRLVIQKYLWYFYKLSLGLSKGKERFYYIKKNIWLTIPFLRMQIELNKSVFGVIIQTGL